MHTMTLIFYNSNNKNVQFFGKISSRDFFEKIIMKKGGTLIPRHLIKDVPSEEISERLEEPARRSDFGGNVDGNSRY